MATRTEKELYEINGTCVSFVGFGWYDITSCNKIVSLGQTYPTSIQ